MSNELSELQAVDFAVGEFIAAAFDGFSLTTGPKEWREFLGRATAAQVYRHDAASPGDFLKALQSSRKAETGPANNKQNTPPLPAVYYFRKPGFSNINDRSKQLRGRISWSEDLARAYSIRALHLDLDYTIVFTAWDKPTLDKLCMAWYSYIVTHDTAKAKYLIGTDVMEVPVTVQDHCNLTISDSSEPAETGRLFAATTNYTMHTMVLFGAEVTPPPANMRIQYGLEVPEQLQVIAGYGNGINTVFGWSAETATGKTSVEIIGARICVSGSLIALWDGTAWRKVGNTYDVAGVFSGDAPASVNVTITPAPPTGAQVDFCMDTNIDVIATACPSCHTY